MEAPPSYDESIGLASFNSLTNSINNNGVLNNFCAKCGKLLDGCNTYQCASCGYILVQQTQLQPSYNPFPYNPFYPPSGPSSASSLPQPSIDPSITPYNNHPLLPPPPSPATSQEPPVITKQPVSQPQDDVCARVVDRVSPPTEPARHPNDMAVRVGNRLYIDFEKMGNCFWDRVGLDENVKKHVPIELNSKGIVNSQWESWMKELNDDIQKFAPSTWGNLCVLCFPFLLPQWYLFSVICPLSYDHPLSCLLCCHGDWHEKLRKWQKKVNETLNRHLMHAKLVTYKPYQNAPKSKLYSQRTISKNSEYEISYLVIALNKEESEKLIDESFAHGIRPNECMYDIGRAI